MSGTSGDAAPAAIDARGLGRRFGKRWVVRGLDLAVPAGSITALLGRNGAGKSTTIQMLLGLLAPTEGQVSVLGRDPRRAAIAMLEQVGIPEPEIRSNQYPFELSGGMCQRAMIAMALICRPKLLIADEPTTALDVTIQAQILELMKRLREETGTAILLITHDMGVVADMADRVAVMYAGRVIEQADVGAIFALQEHPYTRLLLSTIPRLDGRPKTILPSIEGMVPDIGQWPAGCRFNPRCPLADAQCIEAQPPLSARSDVGLAACWHSDRVEAML